jgi:hypothetical protein
VLTEAAVVCCPEAWPYRSKDNDSVTLRSSRLVCSSGLGPVSVPDHGVKASAGLSASLGPHQSCRTTDAAVGSRDWSPRPPVRRSGQHHTPV